MKELEFGKKVLCGNYYILKRSKSLSKAEVAKLRNAQGIPADIQKHLQRASLPYIKVATISDSWSVEFVIGMTMYEFLNTVEYVFDGDGNRLLVGKEKNCIENIILQMMTDTTLIGDKEYRIGKLKLQQEYLERASKAAKEADEAGKTEEQLRKESEEAINEVMERDKHAATILEMGEQVKKEEREAGHDEQH